MSIRRFPVIFLDTGWLFEETLAYRDTLIATLGLRDVRSIKPLEAGAVARGSGSRIVVLRSRRLLPDPQGRAARARAGAVSRLDQRPQAFSGRRRAPRFRLSKHDGGTAEIQSVRQCLARGDRGDLCARPICRRIRSPPAVFCRSAACPAPAAARPDEDARAGRWRGRPKTECGIHTAKTL